MEPSNIRNHKIDNAKGLFIILVLLAHTPPILTINNISIEFKMLIHCTIMPAFFFFSGMLSKNPTKRADKAIKNLLIPYVLFSILSVFFNQIRHGLDWNIQTFNLFLPKGFMWYLGALFWMVLLLPHIIKFQYPILIASVVSFVASLFLQDAYEYCALGIAFSMFPMFLLGYYVPVDFYQKYSKVLFFAGGVIGIIGIIALTMNGNIYFRFRPHFYHQYINEEFIKVLCFGFATLIVLMVVCVLPNKVTFLTTIGKNSILVYVFHEYIYSFIGHLFDIDNDYLDLLIATTVSILVSYFLSRHFFVTLYTNITTPINKLLLKWEQ